MAEDHGLLALALGNNESPLLESGGWPARRARVDGLALGAELCRNGWVPRQVESFQHRHHRRYRQHVHVAATGHLLLAADGRALDLDALQTCRHRPAERICDADTDLIVPGVGGFVAEEDEVEDSVRRLVGTNRF